LKEEQRQAKAERRERGDYPNRPTCQSVARVYLVSDSTRVQARANAFGTNANVPGIEVSTESQTNVRRKP